MKPTTRWSLDTDGPPYVLYESEHWIGAKLLYQRTRGEPLPNDRSRESRDEDDAASALRMIIRHGFSGRSEEAFELMVVAEGEKRTVVDATDLVGDIENNQHVVRIFDGVLTRCFLVTVEDR